MTDNVQPMFDARRWLADWEAAGGALHVVFAPGTKIIRQVRFVLPKAATGEQLAILKRLADEGNTISAHTLLPRLMQARLDDGQGVREYAGSATGEFPVNDWQ